MQLKHGFIDVKQNVFKVDKNLAFGDKECLGQFLGKSCGNCNVKNGCGSSARAKYYIRVGFVWLQHSRQTRKFINNGG
ncbi:hypothetical protein [Vibrio sp. 1-2-3a]|uniref:hypothetical protein n=1 Tax=Vibrio sp. 1-2-3a TaxID=2650943 RepID=UPI00292E87EB|nr:hypothetical protein [Vibrio sp. 1-2-3a]